LVASVAPKSIGLNDTVKNLPRSVKAKEKPPGLSQRAGFSPFPSVIRGMRNEIRDCPSYSGGKLNNCFAKKART
jgi:hypothetical protein